MIGIIAISGCKKEKNYIVTFDANGGSGEMAPQTFTEGISQTISVNTFTKENNPFNEWNTIADGSGISYTNKQDITISKNMTLYAQWSNHAYINLGLPSGTLWAETNLGAENPEDYGDYYAWGETSHKMTYNWNTYKYYNENSHTLTKYCSNTQYGDNGYSDTLTTLETSDDAATANWGNAWRMPTYDEMNELLNNCTVNLITRNGTNGFLFTGHNGNSIFLPITDGRQDSAPYSGSAYWSSTLRMDHPLIAWTLQNLSECYVIATDRYYGLSVRPVCNLQN